MEIIFSLILAGIGIFNIVAPEEAIYLQNFWRFDSFAPSERYIRQTRISGGVAIVVAIALLIYFFAS